MTVGPGYFDAMYAAAADPWSLRTRWYEERKYAISAAMLPRRRYGEAFEPGCSVGELTGMLAGRCDRLLSCDIAQAAVKAAAEHTANIPNVTVEHRAIPRDWPPGQFDLIVLSEFLYYFAGGDLDDVLDLAVAALRPSGALLAVHWRHPVTEYPRSGDEVHAALADRAGLARLADHAEPDFLAEVYIRSDGVPVSVAQAEGLV
jgi:cyclopropane fatty-acyl-phospholipid synthase-like methyltransferase